MINQNFQSDLVHFPDFHTHQKGNVFSIFNVLPDDGIPDQCFSWGIHPWYLNENWEKELEKIEVFLLYHYHIMIQVHVEQAQQYTPKY